MDEPKVRGATEQGSGTVEGLTRAENHHRRGVRGGAAAGTETCRLAAAVVRPADPAAPPVVLLNPRITERSDEADEQFEGCLSFFDVRGLVPRPLRITVETTTLDGLAVTTTYQRGLARLVHHEIDHLDDLLYTSRMRAGTDLIPVEQYRQTGRAWTYE
ncbi:peptide deformylase [Streptomyces sp. CG1]|uniref:peptide deformylase n=1 Tax=Streptomyces sp. CG1 TaxID=1287523 RepID=UPI0034E1A4C3